MVLTAEQFDVVIIGGGPGGYAAALYGASAGLSVAVVEEDKVGGTCLHRGCVPAKQFLETAFVSRTVAGAKEFGIQASQPSVDFAVSQARKRKVVDQLWKGLAGLMKKRKIVTVAGSGSLGRDRVVRVDNGRELQGRHVILATGSVPVALPGFDVDGQLVMTSDELLDLETLPGSVVVVGGGAVGCEFASMLADLGTQVTVLEALPSLLPGCDTEVVEVVTRSFKKRGIVVHTGAAVAGHQPNGTGTVVAFGSPANDGTDQRVTVDTVVICVGRRPRSDGVVEEGLGVETDPRGSVVVDRRMRTGADGVYAVGDLVAGPQLAHVGFAEAMVAIRDIMGEPAMPVDYQRVPWCIYTHPEVAFAGLSEDAARAAGYEVVVKADPFGGNSRARILGETDGLVKVIAERRPGGAAGRLLGVHMVGPWVTEQLGPGYLALNWEAVPEEVGHFVQPHPTLSEAFGEAALALTGRGLHVG